MVWIPASAGMTKKTEDKGKSGRCEGLLYCHMFNNMKLLYNTCHSGYITLLSILVVGAVGVAITLSLILLGLGTSRASFAYEQSSQAKGLTNVCAEEAMQRIRDSTPFTGSNTLTLGAGMCSYTVTSQGSQNRTIIASGTVGTMIRKARIIIDRINPIIRVISWQEIADF